MKLNNELLPKIEEINKINKETKDYLEMKKKYHDIIVDSCPVNESFDLDYYHKTIEKIYMDGKKLKNKLYTE